MSELLVREVDATDAEALVRLLELGENGCFCQYWQFPEDHRAWQVRCAQEPERNRENLHRDLGEGKVQGLVAARGEELVGWLRLERPPGLAKLYQGRLYRGLPCLSGERGAVWAVACLFVAPGARRSGVARNLVAGAIRACQERNATAIEAFPRGRSDVSDEEQWMGPLAIYRELGFAVVHDFEPYPVLRRDFGSSGA